MRRQLVRELSDRGIKSKQVLDCFEAIPRHYFLDNAFAEQAYSNTAFQIGSGQTISHPYTVAYQTELLDIQKGEKILEIGSGSGFQTCVLCEMGAKVFSIERHKELHLKAKNIVRQLKYNARLSFGDGYKGLPTFAPFDKIIITCGAPDIPEELVNQMKVGGIMIIPIGEGVEQQMKKIVKISEGEITIEDFGVFKFVPMLENKVK
ncbi:MAG: protein-L-isoaspartate(D-aspartate) O-methyltransferase [Crocinitomicaceae bacterium]|nr:protein-L-isoaspartate(D-aspartate) O-methyltransferase [Crocinitomicaceae bacterium]MDC1384851.1 protein-L-isoaspartate(D-aspartate) O-methyltransferase [Crocinitomicaceae bacterium]